MLLISNNLQKYMKLPKKSVIRINMAWVKNIEELEKIIIFNKNKEIFLDYPQGRSKPPKPTLSIENAFTVLKKYKNIKYFAVSNIEKVKDVKDVMNNVPKNVEFIPKIETLHGVKNLKTIINECKIKILQLDAEDLYTDVRKDNIMFFECIEAVRSICKSLKVTLLELEGVVFSEKK